MTSTATAVASHLLSRDLRTLNLAPRSKPPQGDQLPGGRLRFDSGGDVVGELLRSMVCVFMAVDFQFTAATTEK